MTETLLISIAEQRLSSFIRKVYGKDAHVSPETLFALRDYLKKGSFDQQFYRFLMACDAQEEQLLMPKSKPPKRAEDVTAINLIDLARDVSA